MKKTLSYMSMLALLIAGCLTLACTELTDERDVVVRNADGSITYILSVDREAGTKALAEDGNNLKKTFAEGDRIAVVYTVGSTTKVATSEALASNKIKKDGKYAEFSVTLEDKPDADSWVKYIYPASLAKADGTVNYAALATQNGTLASLASNLDLGYKEITLSGTTFPTGVKLENPLTIVKFTLESFGGTDISVKPLTVSVGGSNYVITPSSASHELFVAIPAVTSEQTITLTATGDASKPYIYQKTGVSLNAGQYYEIIVKMSVNLAGATSNITLVNGDKVTGTLSGNHKISIADGATVTLSNATINGVNSSSYTWAGLSCLGGATIVLADGTINTVRGFYENYPGIHIPEGNTLTIQGTGTLNVSNNGDGAGIGGGWVSNCGNILIKNGIINATGSREAAGIGSGFTRSCGFIEIQGGTITATGGTWAAGIGTGGGVDGHTGIGSPGDEWYEPSMPAEPSSCGAIIISGGTVVATGGDYAAGIGTGEIGNCGNITITDGVTRVTATRGDRAQHSIGTGNNGWNFSQNSYTVTIGGVEGKVSTSPFTYQP